MTTQTIMASLDQKMLANADRYFTTDLETLVDEIVQNARRAGATTLRIDRRDGMLVIEDDGRGLPAERANVLLRLGGSANTAAIENDENAAGMGFFALARYGVVVRSHDWEMTITPDAFLSKAPATLTTGHPYLAGMRLSIPGLNKAPNAHKLIDGALFVAATQFTGMRLHVAGCTGVEGWHEPQSFLDVKAARAAQTASRRVHGVTIKVCRGHQVESGLTVNFFGKVITKSLRADLFPVEHVAEIENLGQSLRVRDTKVATAVLIDVHDTSALKLLLPQRAQIVEDEGFAQIQREAMSILQDILLKPGTANAVDLNSPLRKGRGAAIPLPQIAIQTALQTENDYVETTRMSRDGRLVTLSGQEIPLANVIGADLSDFYIALLRTNRAETVLGEHGILDANALDRAFGEGSYRRIAGIQLGLRVDGEELTVDLFTPDFQCSDVDIAVYRSPDLNAMPSRLVDDLALTLTLEGPVGTERLTVPIPAFFHCWERDTYEPVLWLVPDQDDDIVTTMMDGIRWYRDDEDGDYDTASDYISGQYNALVAKLTGTSEAAFLGDLQEQIENLLRRHFGHGEECRRFSIAMTADDIGHGFRFTNKTVDVQPVPVEQAA